MLGTSIKKWYKENFPTDDMVDEISEKATFEGLTHILNEEKDFYHYVGEHVDSVMRERIFEQLTKFLGCSYEDIYQKWLRGGRP